MVCLQEHKECNTLETVSGQNTLESLDCTSTLKLRIFEAPFPFSLCDLSTKKTYLREHTLGQKSMPTMYNQLKFLIYIFFYKYVKEITFHIKPHWISMSSSSLLQNL